MGTLHRMGILKLIDPETQEVVRTIPFPERTWERLHTAAEQEGMTFEDFVSRIYEDVAAATARLGVKEVWRRMDAGKSLQ